jgi:hypothetical protein
MRKIMFVIFLLTSSLFSKDLESVNLDIENNPYSLEENKK